MAKKNKTQKSAAEVVAEQVAPETKQTSNKSEEKKDTSISVIQLGDLDKLAKDRATSGLDPNHTVDLLKIMHETYRIDPNASKRYDISQEAVDKINKITAIAQASVLINEVMIAQTPFAVSMRVSQLEALKEVAPFLGLSFDTKALPAPKENGIIEVPSTSVKITQATKKEVQVEQKAAAKVTKDNPNDIENEQELKDALLKILIKGNGSPRFYDKVTTAINFFRAYLNIQANKSDDKDAKLDSIKKKSNVDLLGEIAALLGKCTFTINGMAKFLFESTQRSKSPVSAFCTFRDASLNEKTGMPQIDDSLVADIVKILIKWYATSEIDSINKGIEVLKKDAKANKKAIDGELAKIKTYEETIGYVMNPSRDIADNFIDDYNDNKSEGFKAARMAASKILKTYYPGLDVKNANKESLEHNLQQYVGVITNMFLPALNQIGDYSAANITDIAVEEKKEDDNSKKAQGQG